MKRLIINLFIVISTISCHNEAMVRELPVPITGSWGDQGDGTFVNPILCSNYPDSDVEKYRDKWYMISSKGRYMKGMTLLESSDLVNWEISGGIVDSLTWETGQGVWAGDLSFREGKCICHFIDFDKGLFVSTADSIGSAWNKPRLILERKGMTDPAVFWDENCHQAYMVCNHRIENTEKGRLYHLRLFKMSWDGTEILDDGVDIYSGIGSEAAKIYRFGEYFYIFISEWTMDDKGQKSDRRQAVLRSKNIYGPYEKRIILEKGNGTTRSCCQGSFIQATDSSWWYMHQLVQAENTFEGRPQCLIPAGFNEEKWPFVGVDSDGNGIGNIVWRSKKPIDGKPIRVPDTDDDFNSPSMGHQWLWNGNPIAGKWSLSEKKGWLRLYSVPFSENHNPFSINSNVLVQRKMGVGKDTVTVKMRIKGMEAGQYAGLTMFGNNYQAIGVRCNEDGLFVSGQNSLPPVEKSINGKQIWLRIVADGRRATCFFSTNGKLYLPIGEEYELNTSGFNGVFIGLFSWNDSGSGYVDFDWFSYKYDGPKVKELSR